jgi:hypothetical protein
MVASRQGTVLTTTSLCLTVADSSRSLLVIFPVGLLVETRFPRMALLKGSLHTNES